MPLKNNIIIKASAKADLEEIYLYSFNEFGLKKTEKYIKDIDLSFKKLSQNYQLGKIYHYRKGYRFFKVASHIIFYRISINRILIIRILHKSMNYEKHL